MSVQNIRNVRIAGISAAVPKNIVENRTCGLFDSAEEYEKFAASVGVERRRVISEKGQCCSDLCQHAAEQLLADLNWDKNEVDLLVYVSQSMDYILPATACCIQERMHLSSDCMAFDIGLGCSGWTYGLGVVCGMMQSGNFRKALLLAGDAKSDPENGRNKGHDTLFGAAGTATALVFDMTASAMLVESGTDGSGYEAIIKKCGASRYPLAEKALEWRHDENGNITRDIETHMDGPSVFIFGITRVPKCIKSILTKAGETVDNTDLFLFHQANLMMNEKIRKKCTIPVEKCPYSLRDFGNNSSASIPLTIVTQVADQVAGKPCKIVACGFGVGLSWSTVYTTLQCPVISPLVEV